MEIGGKRLLVCDCEKTMPLAADKLAKACAAVGGEGEIELQTQLCRAQVDNFRQALRDQESLLIACTQEAPLFLEIAAEDAAQADAEGGAHHSLSFVNIRETAGWSDQATSVDTTAKIAALLAEAAVPIPPTPGLELRSKGVCLVYGKDDRALDAAKQLAGRLEVTLLLSEPEEILPPVTMDVPIFQGTIVRAEGHLGGFAVNVARYAPASPSSRRALAFEPARDDAYSECDLILDLTGGSPLFPAQERRDGYFRPDPDDPAAVQKALFEIADMVGEYDKPLYVRFDADLCAHSRSRKTGCTRCLDVCPTAAISPAGDTVAIDPQVCAGCGACASVCPTGAASYQLPGGESLFERLRTFLSTYRAAGGADPILLLFDGRHGAQMIAALARAGRGLPGHVLPFALNEVTQVGLDFLASALAYGATQIAILAGRDKVDELAGLAQQIGLAETVMEGLGYGGGRLHVLDQEDPDALEAALYGLSARAPAPAGSFLPLGGKRTRMYLALQHLHARAEDPPDILPLPPGAPFGAVKLAETGCTLCLACVGACPTGALLDDEDKPWLGFNEEACVQCGLCRVTCPESVITLEPRLNFTEEARGAVTLNEEPPFHCIRCGKPFGVASSIERIVEQLAGQHAMFQDPAQIERIKMCDDCRVIIQFERQDDPMAGAPRPTPRTTSDYLREEEIEDARAKLLEERAKAQPEDGDGQDQS